MNVLEQIVSHKRKEVEELKINFPHLNFSNLTPSPYPLSSVLKKNIFEGRKTFIAEYKRKSPSEGSISENDLITTLIKYDSKGCDAFSILTDKRFFGGATEDLQTARNIFPEKCLLQKDFIIDEFQISLARFLGADVILLIASILSHEELKKFHTKANSLGMDVICEIHDEDDLKKVSDKNFPIVGINTRNLKNFNLSLNTVAYLKRKISNENIFIIAESGITDTMDFRVLEKNADGFLIGTALMKNSELLNNFKKSSGQLIFKACGLRNNLHLESEFTNQPDLIGVNFTPLSPRRVNGVDWERYKDVLSRKGVLVFRGNSEEEILSTIEKIPHKYVQIYFEDANPSLLEKIYSRKILAFSPEKYSTNEIENLALLVDFFILDSRNPGSGSRIEEQINFPYPFLLAGGVNENNILSLRKKYEHRSSFLGFDIASGIEINSEPDAEKIKKLKTLIQQPC